MHRLCWTLTYSPICHIHFSPDPVYNFYAISHNKISEFCHLPKLLSVYASGPFCFHFRPPEILALLMVPILPYPSELLHWLLDKQTLHLCQWIKFERYEFIVADVAEWYIAGWGCCTCRPVGIIRHLSSYPIGIIRIDLIAYSISKGLNCLISLYELPIRSKPTLFTWQ